MPPKKRLGKDPFVSIPPANPEVAVPPTEEIKVKAPRVKKPRTPAQAAAAAPIAALPPAEKAPAVPRIANTTRDVEIENIKHELAELQARVLKLQQQLDALTPWNEYFFSPWQWWFSLFS